MGLFKEIKCGRCDRRFSSIRGRCPYCGARKNRGGKRAANQGNWQLRMIAGILILIVLIVAAIILVSKSLNNEKTPGPSPTISFSGNEGVSELTPSPNTEPTPPTETVEPTSTVSPSPTVSAIKLNREDFTLSFVGEQWTMTATLSPAGSDAEIKWRSEDEGIAIVNQSGVVTAINRGTTNIVCEAGGATAKCIVRVNADSILGGDSGNEAVPDSEMTLSHQDVTISAAESESFTLTVRGTTASPTFSSDDTGVATVSPEGVVKAISRGSANISASVNGVTLKCIVRVN